MKDDKKPTTRPDKPEWLTEIAAAEWDIVAPELERLGLLTRVDGPSLAAYCQFYGEYVTAQKFLKENGQTYIMRDKDGAVKTIAAFPNVSISQNAARQMRALANDLGFTPAARTKLTGSGKSKDAMGMRKGRRPDAPKNSPWGGKGPRAVPPKPGKGGTLRGLPSRGSKK